MQRARMIVGVALAGLALGATAQGIHKWVDADGVVHYGSSPPASGRSSTEVQVQDSSFGGSGLRPGEREMLRRIEQDEYVRDRERSMQRSDDAFYQHREERQKARQCERYARMAASENQRNRMTGIRQGRLNNCP